MVLKKIKLAITTGKRVLPDTDRKPLKSIYKDLKWIKKESPNKDKGIQHYFESLVYKKNAGNVKYYLPIRVQKDIKRETRHYTVLNSLVMDKRKFKELAIENKIPSATYLGKINGDILKTPAHTTYNLKQKKDTKELFSNWLNDYKGVCIKRTDSSLGRDVFIIRHFDDFQKLNLNPDAEYVLETEIQQHKKLNKINPNCVMSLRVITLLKKDIVHILGCAFSMGYGNLPIDNATMGSVFVRYDIYKNKLDNVGYRSWKFGGKSYLKHPNTGFEFKNKSLPYPDKVINLVKKAAKVVPDKELIGWDVAYTEDGPVIIEGNNWPGIGSMQINLQGLLNNTHFKELFYEYFNKDGTLKI